MPLYFRQDFSADKQRMGEFGEDLGSLLGAGVSKFKEDVGGLGKLGAAWRKYKEGEHPVDTIPMSFKDWKKSDKGLAAKAKIKDDRVLSRDKAFKERIAGKDWGAGVQEAYTQSIMDRGLAAEDTQPGAFRNWMKGEEGKKFKKQAKQDARVARRGERFVGRLSDKDWYDDARMTFDTQGGHFGDTSDAGFKRWMGTPGGEQAMEAAKSAVEADRRLPQEIAAARAMAVNKQWDAAQAGKPQPSAYQGNIGMQLGTGVSMPSDPTPVGMWDDYEAQGTITLPPITRDPSVPDLSIDPDLIGPSVPWVPTMPTRPQTPITEEWAWDEWNEPVKKPGLLGRVFGGFKRGG